MLKIGWGRCLSAEFDLVSGRLDCDNSPSKVSFEASLSYEEMAALSTVCSSVVPSYLRRIVDVGNLDCIQKESGYIIFLKCPRGALLPAFPRVIRPEECDSRELPNADAKKHQKKMKNGSTMISSMANKWIDSIRKCKQ